MASITLLTILIAFISVLLILAVLVQNPKGGGIDETLGRGANQVFGAARSADFIEKFTWYLAAALLILCVVTTLFVTSGGENSVKLLSQ
jgi:preprotein translocase subunit SecG